VTVYIRVDSGEAIGSGHVMRCLTLADRIKQDTPNRKIIFLSKPHHKNIIPIIKQRGFDIITLSSPEFNGNNDEKTWLGTSPYSDFQEIIAVISLDKETHKTLIIDHYSLDIDWEILVRPYVHKIIVIDDLANRSHDCDILLDQNFYLDKNERYKGLVPRHTQLFLGPEYALLRPEFYDYAKNYQFKEDIKNLFVFFGGIDSAGMTLRTIEILKNYPNIYAHIVSSEYCSDWQEISKICFKTPHFTLYSNVDNMAKLMASCDAAIGAGGTTQWERACIGIPSMLTSIANNQTKACENLASEGYIYYSGEYHYVSQEKYSIMLQSFILNRHLRKNIFNRTRKIKFSKSFIYCLTKKNDALIVRSATKDDAKNLFYWRNHENNRLYANHSQEFSMENHVKWLNSVLTDSKRYLYIVSDKKNDIGIVRFDVNPNYNLVSIYLVPNMHGKGYGVHVLEAAEKYFLSTVKNDNPFYAEILPSNQNSINLFKKLGYRLDKKIYTKKISEF
jgi:UDP-2,4-diacetamido-2,4,6-trideoxy-beta-L-altropyranose hydrolase